MKTKRFNLLRLAAIPALAFAVQFAFAGTP